VIDCKVETHTHSTRRYRQRRGLRLIHGWQHRWPCLHRLAWTTIS